MRFRTVLVSLILSVPAAVAGEEAHASYSLLDRLADVEQRLDRLQVELMNRGILDFLDESESIDEIVFPEDGDVDAVREYVRRILARARQMRSFSEGAPEIAMLKRIGRENAGILFEEMKDETVQGIFFSVHALAEIAGEEHKEEILGRLRHHRGLVKVVLRYGWEEEARDILLEEPSGYRETEWVKAIARLQDEEAKQVLLNRLREPGPIGLREYYEIISELDWISDSERADAVRTGWRTIRERDHVRRTDMAHIAIGYGHRDALDFLVEALGDDGLNPFQRNQLLPTLRVHTENGYTRAEILAWYEENKDNLTFDRERRVFRGR